MTSIKKIVFILGLAISSVSAQASPNDDSEIENILNRHSAKGTVIIASKDQILSIYNDNRANTPLSPASTFKIVNSIIALETGAVKNEHEVIKWDNHKYEMEKWNQDQTLKTAFKYSCLPSYQYLAKKIGVRNYKIFLKKFGYGKYHIHTDNLATFWLNDGGLSITPIEQIKFLQRLHKQELPISQRTYNILKNIMLEEDNQDYQIYSKTGTATQNWVGHGWYIGYVMNKETPWFFVINIDINNYSELAKRKEIMKEILKQKKII